MNPGQMTRRGLRLDEGLTIFDFAPSIGIVTAGINKLAGDLGSFREVLEEIIKTVMIPSFRKNFDLGGRPQRWEPLAPETIKLRTSQGFDTKPLVKTGALMEAATSFDIWTIRDQDATVRALPESVWYGKVHQGGRGVRKVRIQEGESVSDTIRRVVALGSAASSGGDVPARPFVLFQEEDMDAIEDILVQWVAKKVRLAGFRTGA